jgi:SpoVK/Ycf46/Vps4 family AAA+-type ATPase
MISQNNNGLYKQKTTFNNIEIKDDRYDIYYGDKFPYDKFKKFMKDENTESLLLLHGDPGSGKSNLLKNLITLADEDVIYIPPSMVSVISSPGFISFMIENKKNFLIIEDAEEILSVDRNSGTNNLLGICDGFLKDALKMKIICTFNCDLKKIDQALLRKGRLYFEYKFGPLSIEEGQRLSDFCNLDIKIDKEMTLAEIFNYHKDVSVENSFEERSIGFGNF